MENKKNKNSKYYEEINAIYKELKELDKIEEMRIHMDKNFIKELNKKDDEIDLLRRSFFGLKKNEEPTLGHGNGEVEFLHELLKTDNYSALYQKFLRKSRYQLYDIAVKAMNNIESGMLPPKELEEQEAIMALALAAIQDHENFLELEKTSEKNEKKIKKTLLVRKSGGIEVGEERDR